eukprot:47770-Pelagomonas_calceolata.AAC.2
MGAPLAGQMNMAHFMFLGNTQKNLSRRCALANVTRWSPNVQNGVCVLFNSIENRLYFSADACLRHNGNNTFLGAYLLKFSRVNKVLQPPPRNSEGAGHAQRKCNPMMIFSTAILFICPPCSAKVIMGFDLQPGGLTARPAGLCQPHEKHP